MAHDRRAFLRTGLTLGAGAVFATSRVGGVTPADLFPVAETAQGKLRGLTAGGIHAFKGVRYGADTSGRNRFRPPAPPPGWSGIRDAINYGQVAPQAPDSRIRDYAGLIMYDIQPGGMGEDCLVLNIWTPGLDRTARRPVLFHLHGGGFTFGSGNSPIYDGEALARFGDCVVVTANHRLGAFGYLNLADQDPDFAQSGLAGMQDIVAALRWVRENIESFGGDPGRVLVFGQSGGGGKTTALMAMPSAKGLFHRAGVMSGSVLKAPSRQEAQEGTRALLKMLGVSGRDIVRQLQALPFQTVLAAQLSLADTPGIAPAARSFAPSIDGDVLPAGPFDPAAPEISRDVPMIIGTTLDDAAFRFTNFDLDEAGLRAFAAKRVGEARARDVLAMYRQEDWTSSPYVIQSRLETDATFRQWAITQEERKAAQGGAPVWAYLWSLPSPAFGNRYGAPHATDLGLSFHDARTPLNGATSDSARLADQIAACWVSFAATGDPNHGRIPHWPAYGQKDRSTMVFDTRPHIENDPRQPFREFWQKG